MDRPRDISQSSWDSAREWEDWYYARMGRECRETVARAIMAERQRCASLLNNGCTLKDGEPIDPAVSEIFHAIEQGLQP